MAGDLKAIRVGAGLFSGTAWFGLLAQPGPCFCA